MSRERDSWFVVVLGLAAVDSPAIRPRPFTAIDELAFWVHTNLLGQMSRDI